LGYNASEAKKVLAKMPKELKKPEEKIKWALQQLSK
jgi:Holliday junction resolvasome RuvABC DNA-binding subunit